MANHVSQGREKFAQKHAAQGRMSPVKGIESPSPPNPHRGGRNAFLEIEKPTFSCSKGLLDEPFMYKILGWENLISLNPRNDSNKLASIS